MQVKYYPHWKEMVVYSAEGPQPQILEESERVKVIVAGLQAGQKIPVHPENLAVYYILEGEGIMIVEDERYAVTPGSTVVVPQDSGRGLEAKTRLAFLATRIA